jgi:post-segregation antitoxin (ccd killing protein)
MRMPRVNIYLPDDLAAEARRIGLNISALTQDSIRQAMAARRINAWLDELTALGATGIRHQEVVEAVRAARQEFGHG